MRKRIITFLTEKWWAILIGVFALATCTVLILTANLWHGNSENQVTGPQRADNDLTGKYAVSFYSDNGTVLKIDYVEENKSAIPPAAPAMSYGTIFKAWDTDFSKVTQDLEVHPVCEDVKKKTNVLAVQSRYSIEGGTVVVPIQLCGNVCVAGLDITVRYNHELLDLQSVTEDKGVIFNDETPGVINMNYVSTRNTVADVDICNLQFYVNAVDGEIPITVEINGIYAFEDEDASDALYVPESMVVNGKMFVVN